MDSHKPSRRRGVFRAPASKPDTSDQAVLRVMRQMITEDKDLTADEKPEAPALSVLLGFKVDPKRRDRLMNEV